MIWFIIFVVYMVGMIFTLFVFRLVEQLANFKMDPYGVDVDIFPLLFAWPISLIIISVFGVYQLTDKHSLTLAKSIANKFKITDGDTK